MQRCYRNKGVARTQEKENWFIGLHLNQTLPSHNKVWGRRKI